ncbi:MAG: flagellar basal body rod protein FlgB [Spirochaetales bacterium]|nr:flagellar basal body rod protein FlgB [Spirochaetales bacterium]
MFTGNSFGKTLDILHRTMDVSMLRRRVIADNIANADTPHFKRTDVNFEAFLKKALESETQHPALGMAVTSGRHIPNFRPLDYRDVQPVKHFDYLSTSDNNGNNVDLEIEGMLALQNQMDYDLMVSVVRNNFNQVNSVLR